MENVAFFSVHIKTTSGVYDYDVTMSIYLNAMMHLPIGSLGLALFTYMLAHVG